MITQAAKIFYLQAAKRYENSLGRPLTSEERFNLKTYGAISAQEYAPEPDDLAPGQCVCGAFECSEEYAHHTSGW